MKYLSYWRTCIQVFWKLPRSLKILPVLWAIGIMPGTGWGQSDELGFDDQDTVSEMELAQNSGGTEINIDDIGVNLASNSSSLNGNSVDGNVVTGGIGNNDLNDVSGINSLMFNTGNNVNFQSNMQINIFLK